MRLLLEAQREVAAVASGANVSAVSNPAAQATKIGGEAGTRGGPSGHGMRRVRLERILRKNTCMAALLISARTTPLPDAQSSNFFHSSNLCPAGDTDRGSFRQADGNFR